MLHLYCNLHHPSPPLLLPLQKQFFPTPFPIERVKGVVERVRAVRNGSMKGSLQSHYSLPNGMFRVRLDNEDLILGYISGKIRQNFSQVEVNHYDTSKGRIIYRIRNRSSNG
ncbi:hypothetical protein Pint_17668 [Pistacia integerrima]|uniref:Uncharacterized protein n=1 Tax=Pistacia integerrima TaxID=434235 RepID=A0ACC0YY08_9ROSI|nr:hypothetical protein Pint_17668 [Pistacia integerrima]